MDSVIVILGLLLISSGLTVCWVRYRKRLLRAGFGPEYGRVLQESENARAADRELIRRRRRHAVLHLRPIGPEAQNGYAVAWRRLQERFADDPSGAVQSADELVNAVITARGYPADGCAERLALLSARYPCAVAQFREARLARERGRSGAATTEELRTAFAQYRVLFGELMVTPRRAWLR